MKAIIYAAGMGSRLKPLTDSIPKALVKIHNLTLLEIAIRKLIRYGFNEIIINIHHLGDKIIEFLKINQNFGITIHISDERGLLLDTGGALKKTKWFFNGLEPFLVHNVDVLSDINIKDMYNFHIHSNAIATLAVSNRKTSRHLLFNNNNLLCGWENIATGTKKIISKTNEELNPLAFSGIHIINPSIFILMNEEGHFSIIDVYLRLAKKLRISGYIHNQNIWLDVGKKETLAEAENYHLETFL